MASAMRKMAVYLGLVEDEERDPYASEYGEDEYDEPATVRRHPASDGHPAVRAYDGRPTVTSYSPPPPRAASADAGDAYRITTLHPRTYNEARTIGEHFRDGIPVIMNLTEMDDTDAKRLVDFAAGLIFGLRGSIERITNKVFLLTPANVEIGAEDKSLIAEGGFFNQS